MENFVLNINKFQQAIDRVSLVREIGKITRVTGQLMAGFLPGSCIGSICEIYPGWRSQSFSAEVVGFEDRQVLLLPLGDMQGVGLGSKIVLKSTAATVRVGPELLGRVIDGLGRPIDGQGDLELMEEHSVYNTSTNPMDRTPIRESADLGVRAINGLLTLGRGQRVSIMAGSGVGKSVLLAMMARNAKFDVNVIALVGERGREVREFIEETLGPEGLRRSVVVVATSDQNPLVRMRAAFVATAIAEYFCRQGSHVLMMMDSITRFAMAQREIGLNTGEPPASKGYTPSVFSLLPKLLERAGAFEGRGSITGLYNVLVEGDDMDDPIGDCVRSIVDGHIVLTRSLAQRGHFPAIDVLQSTSRVMRQVTTPYHQQLAASMRENLATYQEVEDLINIGAYKSGSNSKIDQAIEYHDPILQFLKQSWTESTPLERTVEMMAEIQGEI